MPDLRQTAAMTQPPARARSIAELQEKLSLFFTREGYAAGLAFQPRADDILIATFPKCGTTWMQQILHGLRTRGDMDFEEISVVVPWLEACADMGLDPDAAHAADPRCYKTHLAWGNIPKGARYIHVSRDPHDALVSLYRFLEGWFFEPGSIGLDEFAREHFLAGRRDDDYWSFLLSWWERRSEDDVLFMFFEDMKEDLASAVETVAAFAGIPLDDDLREIVLRQSAHAFMKAREHQFDDHPLRDAREAACGLPRDGASTKVAAGRSGAGRSELSAGTIAALDARWRDTVGRETGLLTYEELRIHCRARQG